MGFLLIHSISKHYLQAWNASEKKKIDICMQNNHVEKP